MLSSCQVRGISALPFQTPLVSGISLSVASFSRGLLICGRGNAQNDSTSQVTARHFIFIAYLGSDLHEFQWLRVFKGQELVKVNDKTTFYLYYLSVV